MENTLERNWEERRDESEIEWEKKLLELLEKIEKTENDEEDEF